MRALLIVLSAGLLFDGLAFPQDSEVSTPKLLLTPQRLRRLERDRTRQTARWTNFETRVNTVSDSPERGFELALYYAVTHDEKRGREAVQWALAHPCNFQRQVELILDWCGPLISAEEKARLASSCVFREGPPEPVLSEMARDQLFSAIARGESVGQGGSAGWKRVLLDLQNGMFAVGGTLYAACEYLAASRSAEHIDLRQDDPKLFSELPVEFLLSLRPGKVQHPDWMTHITALALVALDPNLESSQFLQGWAISDAHMLRDGPGVAYELLWADPYLPGVGYENLDPWTYDSNGRLFARASWNSDACWIEISSRGVEQENCPPAWQNAVTWFGHLKLIPMTGNCTDVPHRKTNSEPVILWKMGPHQMAFYVWDKRKEPIEADEAGMWRVPENVEGRVCKTLDKLKRP